MAVCGLVASRLPMFGGDCHSGKVLSYNPICEEGKPTKPSGGHLALLHANKWTTGEDAVFDFLERHLDNHFAAWMKASNVSSSVFEISELGVMNSSVPVSFLYSCAIAVIISWSFSSEWRKDFQVAGWFVFSEWRSRSRLVLVHFQRRCFEDSFLLLLHKRHLRLVDSTQSPSAEVAPNLIAAICFRLSSGRLM